MQFALRAFHLLEGSHDARDIGLRDTDAGVLDKKRHATCRFVEFDSKVDLSATRV